MSGHGLDFLLGHPVLEVGYGILNFGVVINDAVHTLLVFFCHLSDDRKNEAVPVATSPLLS